MQHMGTLKFVAIAVVFMLLADHFIFDGKRSYIEANKTHESTVVAEKEVIRPEPEKIKPPKGAYFEAPMPESKDMVEEEMTEQIVEPEPAPELRQEKRPVVHGTPKIAIIIDDIGMDIKHSHAAIDLPAPVTMAMLPYAPRIKEMAKEAKAKGHTLIIHAPMEAMDRSVNIGPGGLKQSMDAAAMAAAFDVMLNSFDGYEGINNHMGSRLTQDKEAMDRVMKVLASRGLFFVDSKTSGKSVAAIEAQEEGVPFASRDIFLDHVDSAEFVWKALRQTEARALKHGYAIAIGHPKAHTLAALNAWLPTLKAKGIELVSVKALLVRSNPALLSPREQGEGSVASEERVVESNESSAPLPAEPQIQLDPLPQEYPETLFGTP